MSVKLSLVSPDGSPGSEPSAGSDVAGIRATARKQGDHWVLDGDKSFAANASRADWIVVWASVDTKLGREGHRAFVVERGTNGLGDFSVERKMGLKAYESTSFTLRECRVPAANLLGGEAHYAQRAGFKGAMRSFNATRPMVAVMAVVAVVAVVAVAAVTSGLAMIAVAVARAVAWAVA